MKLFLDTNVYVDFLLEREPYYLPAASILSYAAEGYVDVCISSITAINANYICVERFKMSQSVMKLKVLGLKNYITTAAVTESDIYHSYADNWSDFEDGVQYFCAKRNVCDYIVTRNPNDFINSDIKVISPDEAINLLIAN